MSIKERLSAKGRLYLILCALGVLLVGLSVFFFVRVFTYTTIGTDENANFITGRNVYPKASVELDLSDKNIPSLDGLEKLTVLRSLSLNGLGLSELDAVTKCVWLEWLDLRGNDVSEEKYCQLQRALPECVILWDIPIGGELVSSDVTSYTLTSQDPSEYYLLSYMKELTNVDASGAVLCPELLEVSGQMPQCAFYWTVDIGGQTIESSAESLDFNDTTIDDLDAFSQTLQYLPAVTHVELCNSGLSNQQMEVLCEDFPDIKFVWMIHLGVWDMRTDVTNFSTAHIVYRPTIPKADFYQLKYLTDIVALDLGHQYFSDLTPLSGLTTLTALILSDCGIYDISPLAGLVNLEFVELMDNKISDISVIANWTKLERVCLFINNITDFSPLYGLEKLRRVWINKNPGVWWHHEEIASNLPADCDLCTTTRPTGQGYGWRPINYTKLGFTYWHPLNGRSPAGIEGDTYPE